MRRSLVCAAVLSLVCVSCGSRGGSAQLLIARPISTSVIASRGEVAASVTGAGTSTTAPANAEAGGAQLSSAATSEVASPAQSSTAVGAAPGAGTHQGATGTTQPTRSLIPTLGPAQAIVLPAQPGGASGASGATSTLVTTKPGAGGAVGQANNICGTESHPCGTGVPDTTTTTTIHTSNETFEPLCQQGDQVWVRGKTTVIDGHWTYVSNSCELRVCKYVTASGDIVFGKPGDKFSVVVPQPGGNQAPVTGHFNNDCTNSLPPG